MHRTSGLLLALATALSACVRAPQKTPAAWTDASPHRESFVTVAPGVRLEVLDWGGSGPPLVFLSGLQDVAHCFDDFAPQFTDHFHVLALTRRGYGASSQPASGYDLATRVTDLGTALDSLHLTRVVLVGHSIAGDELTAFAAEHPHRVAALVYFDAAYDHSDVTRLLAGYPQQPPMTSADSATPAAVTAYIDRVYGVPIPEAQIRATLVFAPGDKLLRNVTPDSIDAAVLRGTGHPDYAAVRAPALAIYAVPDTAHPSFPWWNEMSDSTRRLARAFTVKLRAWGDGERARFRRELKGGTPLLLPGANHYVFMSNREQVTEAMRTFLAAAR